jgi:hypothetical protein
MTILMSVMTVVIRRHRHVSMLPAASLGSSVRPRRLAGRAGRHGLNFANSSPARRFGLGLLLLTVGARLISATRTALIGALESLAPAQFKLTFGCRRCWSYRRRHRARRRRRVCCSPRGEAVSVGKEWSLVPLGSQHRHRQGRDRSRRRAGL